MCSGFFFLSNGWIKSTAYTFFTPFSFKGQIFNRCSIYLRPHFCLSHTPHNAFFFNPALFFGYLARPLPTRLIACPFPQQCPPCSAASSPGRGRVVVLWPPSCRKCSPRRGLSRARCNPPIPQNEVPNNARISPARSFFPP